MPSPPSIRLISTLEGLLFCQIVVIGYLSYGIVSIGMNDTSGDDWVRPYLRFPSMENFLSRKFFVVKDVCHMLGYCVVVNSSWFTDPANVNEITRYDINLPSDIGERRPIEKIVTYVPDVVDSITFKAKLVSRGGKFIPKAFVMPRQKNEFLNYVKLPKNKKNVWIQKNLGHRGNEVKELHELNLTRASVIQKYIANPFLIDERKFSAAIFVALVSTNPVRAYILPREVNLRFCSKAYYPVDFTDTSTYITDGTESFNVTTVDKMDILQVGLRGRGSEYSHRETFNIYLRSIGKNPDEVYSQMYNAIGDVMIRDNAPIKIDPRTKYFEITRWDFVLDEDLNVYLIEANWWPNMSIEGVAFTKRDIWKHSLYNMLRVAGMDEFGRFQSHRAPYVVRKGDGMVYNEICYTKSCAKCSLKSCYLCSHCLSENHRHLLEEVLLEHLKRGPMRLVHSFENTKISTEHGGNKGESRYPHEEEEVDVSTLMTDWLQAQCKIDITWCSLF